MRLPDVAAGGGGLSIPAAHLGAQVLAAGFSPAMVGLLDARAREEGLSNRHEVSDRERSRHGAAASSGKKGSQR
jgi:2-polyprenyl-3-methyl-5-hydroxy-6-metoxy-1,4-benzoquinol methylase